MNMLLKSLLILIVAVAAGKGKGRGGRRGGGKGKGKGGEKKSNTCRDLSTTDPTRVQGDMVELLKAFDAGFSETMYCGVRGRGYPFVEVPSSSSSTTAPQRRFLERKKSPVSFKVASGAVSTGLVKGCDDDLYCFDNINVSLTSAAADFSLALRRNLEDATEETVTETTEAPVPTTATVTFSQTNPDETFTMTYTCKVDYETTTSTEGEETCTPKGLQCYTKYRLAADTEDRRARMKCSSTMSADDDALKTAVDQCPVV